MLEPSSQPSQPPSLTAFVTAGQLRRGQTDGHEDVVWKGKEEGMGVPRGNGFCSEGRTRVVRDTRHPPGSPARTASPGRSCSESSQPRNFALPRQKNNLPSCQCGMYREDERKSSGKPFPALLEGLAGGCKWIRSPLGSMAQLIRIPGPLSFILKVLFQSTSDTCNAPVGAATPLISFRDRCV